MDSTNVNIIIHNRICGTCSCFKILLYILSLPNVTSSARFSTLAKKAILRSTCLSRLFLVIRERARPLRISQSTVIFGACFFELLFMISSFPNVQFLQPTWLRRSLLLIYKWKRPMGTSQSTLIYGENSCQLLLRTSHSTLICVLLQRFSQLSQLLQSTFMKQSLLD